MWEIDAKSVDAKHHFSLPNDLFKTGTLQLARNSENGTFHLSIFEIFFITREGLRAQ
jgi:hypothetical protein